MKGQLVSVIIQMVIHLSNGNDEIDEVITYLFLIMF